MTFTPHPKAEERKRSAALLTKALLELRNDPQIVAAQLRELLGILLYKITEAESHKYKTRYRSERALQNPQGSLCHDHVYPRAKLIDALLEKPESADTILSTAIGCTVTKEEHDELHQYDDLDGWERYERAGIVVMDTAKTPPEPMDYSN